MRKTFLLLIAMALSGCDQLGIESPATVKARVEADGKTWKISLRDGRVV